MPSASDLTARERILEATYDCVARYGMGKTTVEDVVKVAGLSRATIYRYFPGGRDELLRETVGWESARFMGRLAEAVAGAPDLPSLIEEALRFGRRAILEHAVLQKILATEPERLLPMLSLDHRPLQVAKAFLRPYMERAAELGQLRAGLDLDEAVEFVGRMVLSLAAAPSTWDLDDPEQLGQVVRGKVLAGIAAPPGG